MKGFTKIAMALAFAAMVLMPLGNAKAGSVSLEVPIVQVTNLDYPYVGVSLDAPNGHSEMVRLRETPAIKLGFEFGNRSLSIMNLRASQSEKTNSGGETLTYYFEHQDTSSDSCTVCSVKSETNVNFTVIDYNVKNEVVKNDNFGLSFVSGFTIVDAGQNIDQRNNTEYAEVSYDFSGAGVTTGFEATYGSGSFQWVTSVGYGILYGKSDYNYRYHNNDIYLYDKSENITTSVFKVSVKGNYNVSDSLALIFGYVMADYKDIFEIAQQVDDTTEGSFERSDRSVGYQGLTLGAKLTF